jgi:hypothetical protein
MTPLPLATNFRTALSEKPQREQKRISSETCSWLHLGQYM